MCSLNAQYWICDLVIACSTAVGVPRSASPSSSSASVNFHPPRHVSYLKLFGQFLSPFFLLLFRLFFRTDPREPLNDSREGIWLLSWAAEIEPVKKTTYAYLPRLSWLFYWTRDFSRPSNRPTRQLYLFFSRVQSTLSLIMNSACYWVPRKLASWNPLRMYYRDRFRTKHWGVTANESPESSFFLYVH